MKGEKGCDIRNWRGKCFLKSRYLGEGGKARMDTHIRIEKALETKVGR